MKLQKEIAVFSKMGNFSSELENCSICNKVGQCVWKVSYENEKIDKFCKENNIWSPDHMKQILDNDETNESLQKLTAPMDFAVREANKVKSITGNMRITMGEKITMIQYLCHECYKALYLKLEKLPEDWGWDADFDKSAYKRIRK